MKLFSLLQGIIISHFRFVVCFFVLQLSILSLSASAQDLSDIRIEGHAFSATTLKPLPGVGVEVWGFYQDSPNFHTTLTALTDEGGAYVIEAPISFLDDEGKDIALGYAFAFYCRYQGKRKVQIMPLYRSLVPKEVYHRNVYLQVPENVTKCDGYGS